MGGTFNPPHLAHLMMAERAADELLLESVIFLPTGNFSYKDNSDTAPAKERYEMTRLAISDNPRFDICDVESSSEDCSYTCYTLEKMHSLYPNSHFYFIVGADSLDYMDVWREPKRIFELSSIAAVGRNGFSEQRCKQRAEFLKTEFGADIHFVQMPFIDISSSDIRRRIAQGSSVRYAVPSAVLNYIKERKLYL